MLGSIYNTVKTSKEKGIHVLGTGVGVTSGWNEKVSADIEAETQRSGSRVGVICPWRKVLWGGVCVACSMRSGRQRSLAFPLRGSEGEGASEAAGVPVSVPAASAVAPHTQVLLVTLAAELSMDRRRAARVGLSG